MTDHRPDQVLRWAGIHLVPCLEQKGYGPVTYGCPTTVGKPSDVPHGSGDTPMTLSVILLRPWQSPHIGRGNRKALSGSMVARS
jgi:hypothetical protein